jgi:hypothetical protein
MRVAFVTRRKKHFGNFGSCGTEVCLLNKHFDKSGPLLGFPLKLPGAR